MVALGPPQSCRGGAGMQHKHADRWIRGYTVLKPFETPLQLYHPKYLFLIDSLWLVADCRALLSIQGDHDKEEFGIIKA